MKQGGGIAGHNGLKDISQRLASHDYWRLRLGVGKPPSGADGADYVLQKPTAEERAAIDAAIDKALAVLPLCLAGDLQTAMQQLHSEEKKQPSEEKTQPEKKEPALEPGAAEAAQKASGLKSLFGGLTGRKK